MVTDALPGIWYESIEGVFLNMEAYTSFARVYDIFMDNVPYKEWADYLGKILKEYGIESGWICGVSI